MRAFWLSLLALMVATPCLAGVPSYTVDPAKSRLVFFINQNGTEVKGSFKTFTADIVFDPNQLSLSSIKFEVDTQSITSTNSDVEASAKLPDWFSTEVFPKATFTSKTIVRKDNDNYIAQGELTIRDKTVPIALNFFINHIDDKGAVAKGNIMLKRNDFGIGQGEWAKENIIKNDVRVEFVIAGIKK